MPTRIAAFGVRHRFVRSVGFHPAVLAAIALLMALDMMPAEASRRAPARGTSAAASLSSALAQTPGNQLIWQGAQGVFSPEPAPGPALIRLGAGYELDPSRGDPEAAIPADLRAIPPTGQELGYYLVQLGGPVTQADRQRIETSGARIVSYVPDYSFLVSMSASARAEVARAPGVVWTGLYQPAYKLSTMPEMQEPGRHEMTVLLFPSEDIDAVSRAMTAAGADVKEATDSGINKIIRTDIDVATIGSIARIPGIAWIEPYHRPQWYNDQCQWVVQTSTSNNRHVWDMGIKGENQILSIADTGIRTTHMQFFDSHVPINGFGDYPTHRKIIAYKRTLPDSLITFGDDGGNSYHGTHTSCTLAGDDAPNANDPRDGMAIHAKIYFLDGGSAFQQGVFLPPDLNQLMIVPYTGNAAGAARLMSNSWGSDVSGAYDVFSMTSDQFMWNHPDFLVFFANGNAGPGGGSVGSPATAKDCVGVGGTGDGSQETQYASFTSRGPTADGRYKPTIDAPATLSSAYGANDTGYQTLQGTSMATPASTGATALIRQYLTDGWYPTGAPVAGNNIPDPSAALMKAMAINSADPNITGFTVPDNNIGWGRIDDDNVLYFNGDARRLALVDNTQGLLTGEYVEYHVFVASALQPLKATLVWTDYPGSPTAGVQLVNDLNLTASDGTNTYKGNVYSGGQSQTGGNYDNRNVEENVRLNIPTVGLWTFRVDAVNVPFGPQPFALVITGGLASDNGMVLLNKPSYGATDTLGIRVVDTNAGPSVTVTAASTTEPAGETVTLTGANGIYNGSIPLRPSYPATGDGILSVSDGDQITVTYTDANPAGTFTANAVVDMHAPTITNVHAGPVNETDVTVNWTTSTAGTSEIYYGTTPSLGSQTPLSSQLVVNHAILIPGLSPSQTYYYDVESFDSHNNGVRDDNGGQHYTFTTDQNRDVLLVIGDASYDQLGRYQSAFTRTGWTYTVWQGNQASTALVGNKTSGMASYKTVIWQTGKEQYPMFTDAARDSIASLMNLGSRLSVFTHDTAWDFCDAASADHTTARCQWVTDQLHVTYHADCPDFTTLTGVASDPISGAYTGGLSYTPFRTGGAGDEVNGANGSGTAATDWKDTTPFPVAVRWTGNTPIGNPANSVWGGTPNMVASNFFEWEQINANTADDPVRATILDKTLIWLIGHDHPTVHLSSPIGGENFTGNSVSISWTEQSDPNAPIGSRKIYYSDNAGDHWTLIDGNAGPSPYTWDISSVPNGIQYRVKIVVGDNQAQSLSGIDQSGANFAINRTGGDTRGPVIVAGSITVNPNPIQVPHAATLTATVSDVNTGNSNIAAAEWSQGSSPAAPGAGTPMNGSFNAPSLSVTANLDSNTLPVPSVTLWVRGRDAAGNWGSASSLTIIVNTNQTGGLADRGIPRVFALYANAPNPFRPRTSIRYDLPQATAVRLTIHDVTGRRVRTLVSGAQAAGARLVVWDGRDEEGHPVGSGVYFYSLDAGRFHDTKKMTILR